MTSKPTYPKSKIPKDKELWQWAWENYGGQKTGALGLAIAKYLHWYEQENGNRDGFYNV